MEYCRVWEKQVLPWECSTLTFLDLAPLTAVFAPLLVTPDFEALMLLEVTWPLTVAVACKLLFGDILGELMSWVPAVGYFWPVNLRTRLRKVVCLLNCIFAWISKTFGIPSGVLLKSINCSLALWLFSIASDVGISYAAHAKSLNHSHLSPLPGTELLG